MKLLRSNREIDDNVVQVFMDSLDDIVDGEMAFLPVGEQRSQEARDAFRFAAFNSICNIYK